MSLERRLARLDRDLARADWPRRRLEAWTDEELAAVLDAVTPGYREHVEQLTDEELKEALWRHGLL